MGKRYFTVAEANQLLPELEACFGRVLRLRSQLRTAVRSLEAAGAPLTEDSLAQSGGSPEVQRARAHARGLLEALAEELAAVRGHGVEVKDLEQGLCDFVSRREGRDVYLCWRLGEKEITHWHELSAGFAGRKPLGPTAPRLLH